MLLHIDYNYYTITGYDESNLNICSKWIMLPSFGASFIVDWNLSINSEFENTESLGENSMSTTPIMFRILNPIMKAILKSPFHKAVSGQIMIINFQGAKSGKEYSTPVSYSRENGTVNAFTHANWWKNFTNGAEVKLRLEGQNVSGYATAISADPERITTALYQHIVAVPNDARFYGVTLDAEGQPNMDQVKAAASDTAMVQIKLNN